MEPSQCNPPHQELSKETECNLKHPDLVDFIGTNKTNKQPSFIDIFACNWWKVSSWSDNAPFFSIPTLEGCCMLSFYQITWPPKLTWIYPIKMSFQAYDHIPHCPKTSLGFCPPCCINLYFPRKPFCLIGCLGVQSPNVSMKEGSLFVLFFSYLWDPPNQDASDCVLGLFGKLSRRRGALAWFHDIWTCDAKVFEYWKIFFTEN